MRRIIWSCFENRVWHYLFLADCKISRFCSLQRLETLTPLPTSTRTSTSATGARTGTCAAATTSTHATSTRCRLRWGIRHIRHTASEVLNVADDFLRERLYASH